MSVTKQPAWERAGRPKPPPLVTGGGDVLTERLAYEREHREVISVWKDPVWLEWNVNYHNEAGGYEGKEFATHAEAIAYAQGLVNLTHRA